MKLKSILSKNKKALGTVDIITFVAVIVGLFILAPVLLKVVNESVGGFSTAINQSGSGGEEASARVNAIQNTFVTFWDILIMIGFLVNVVMLLVFSFMVDTHPLFLIFYIFTAMILMMFAPYTLAPVSQILGMSEFATELTQLPLTSFMITHFSLILLGIIVLSGIILYAKFRGRASDL